jgi:hypothetical protein
MKTQKPILKMLPDLTRGVGWRKMKAQAAIYSVLSSNGHVSRCDW